MEISLKEQIITAIRQGRKEYLIEFIDAINKFAPETIPLIFKDIKAKDIFDALKYENLDIRDIIYIGSLSGDSTSLRRLDKLLNSTIRCHGSNLKNISEMIFVLDRLRYIGSKVYKHILKKIEKMMLETSVSIRNISIILEKLSNEKLKEDIANIFSRHWTENFWKYKEIIYKLIKNQPIDIKQKTLLIRSVYDLRSASSYLIEKIHPRVWEKLRVMLIESPDKIINCIKFIDRLPFRYPLTKKHLINLTIRDFINDFDLAKNASWKTFIAIYDYNPKAIIDADTILQVTIANKLSRALRNSELNSEKYLKIISKLNLNDLQLKKFINDLLRIKKIPDFTSKIKYVYKYYYFTTEELARIFENDIYDAIKGKDLLSTWNIISGIPRGIILKLSPIFYNLMSKKIIASNKEEIRYLIETAVRNGKKTLLTKLLQKVKGHLKRDYYEKLKVMLFYCERNGDIEVTENCRLGKRTGIS